MKIYLFYQYYIILNKRIKKYQNKSGEIINRNKNNKKQK